MTGRTALRALIVIVAAAGIWLLFFALPRWYGPRQPEEPPDATKSAEAVRRITATLFYVSADGLNLVGVQREVPFGSTAADQARRIVEEQIKAAPSGHLTAIPAATSLRALYVTTRGEAYVDLSKEIVDKHTGGSLDEVFAVYAIVNAITANLPAIERVQILVDGKEVDTLAGHIDLRRPLKKNLAWSDTPETSSDDANR
jgi:spore germination protein GerM